MPPTHAPPGGVTIGAKKFVGGQFIPRSDLRQATPGEQARIEGKAQLDDGDVGDLHNFVAQRTPRRQLAHVLPAATILAHAPRQQLAEIRKKPVYAQDPAIQRAMRLVAAWNEQRVNELSAPAGLATIAAGTAGFFAGGLLGAGKGGRHAGGIEPVAGGLGGAVLGMTAFNAARHAYRHLAETLPDRRLARQDAIRRGETVAPTTLDRVAETLKAAKAGVGAKAVQAKDWVVRNKKPIAITAAALLAAALAGGAAAHAIGRKRQQAANVSTQRRRGMEAGEVPGWIRPDYARPAAQTPTYGPRDLTPPLAAERRKDAALAAAEELGKTDMRPDVEGMVNARGWFRKDPYQATRGGIPEGKPEPATTPEEKAAIKKRITDHYRQLALAFHPDRGGDAENFKRLETLKDYLLDFQEAMVAVGYWDEAQHARNHGQFAAKGHAAPADAPPAPKPSWARRHRGKLIAGGAIAATVAAALLLHRHQKQRADLRRPVQIVDDHGHPSAPGANYRPPAPEAPRPDTITLPARHSDGSPVSNRRPPTPITLPDDAFPDHRAALAKPAGPTSREQVFMDVLAKITRRLEGVRATKEGDEPDLVKEQAKRDALRQVHAFRQQVQSRKDLSDQDHRDLDGRFERLLAHIRANYQFFESPLIYFDQSGRMVSYATHDVSDEPRDGDGQWTEGGPHHKAEAPPDPVLDMTKAVAKDLARDELNEKVIDPLKQKVRKGIRTAAEKTWIDVKAGAKLATKAVHQKFARMAAEKAARAAAKGAGDAVVNKAVGEAEEVAGKAVKLVGAGAAGTAGATIAGYALPVTIAITAIAASAAAGYGIAALLAKKRHNPKTHEAFKKGVADHAAKLGRKAGKIAEKGGVSTKQWLLGGGLTILNPLLGAAVLGGMAHAATHKEDTYL